VRSPPVDSCGNEDNQGGRAVARVSVRYVELSVSRGVMEAAPAVPMWWGVRGRVGERCGGGKCGWAADWWRPPIGIQRLLCLAPLCAPCGPGLA
jgi:hypothetical protein